MTNINADLSRQPIAAPYDWLDHPSALHDAELRLKCLELAADDKEGRDPLQLARAYYAFVSGCAEQSPRDRILQAMEDAGVR